jgi:N utilization substance protein A
MGKKKKLDIGIDLGNVITAVSKDKNINKDKVINALTEAMLYAARKKIGLEADLEAEFNEESNTIELYQFRKVVENLEDKVNEITLDEALKLDNMSRIGDSIGIKLDANEFGNRVDAFTAKRFIRKYIREAENIKIFEEFSKRKGDIIFGYVKRIEGSDIILDIGQNEAIIPRNEAISTEKFNIKDSVQGYIYDVRKFCAGPQIYLSRTSCEFLKKLFEQSVTEIYDGIVKIEGVARDPGLRSKIAVSSRDQSVDPIGACVGIRGSRVQSITDELNGERIDIVLWDSDPAKLVCNCLSPAVISKVILDEKERSMEVVVTEDQLSLAIGKKGQNVRLAAQLSGWKLDIKSDKKLEKQLFAIKENLSKIPGISSFYANILVNEGIQEIEEIANLTPRTLISLLNLTNEEANKIIKEAKNLKESDFAKEETGDVETDSYEDILANSSASPESDDIKESKLDGKIEVFLNLSGVGEAAAYALADAGYSKIGDILADSVEELSQKTGLSLSVSKTIQIASDKYLKRELS